MQFPGVRCRHAVQFLVVRQSIFWLRLGRMPLRELADAVRKGGNLGAHFDVDNEPDEQLASVMLDLCEDLLEYLFVLPKRIDDLHSRIESLAPPAADHP